MKNVFKIIALLIYLSSQNTPSLSVELSNKIISDTSTSHIYIEKNNLLQGEDYFIVFKLVLKEGWHTYWINPGDSGYTTTIDWLLPEGIIVNNIIWPAPNRLPYGDLTNFGYSNEVNLISPIKISNDVQIGQHTLEADINWLVCKDICIPEQGKFYLNVIINKNNKREGGLNNKNTLNKKTLNIPIQLIEKPSIQFKNGYMEISTPLSSISQNKIINPNTAWDKDNIKINFFPYEPELIINNAVQISNIYSDKFNIKIKTTRAPLPNELVGGVITVQNNKNKLLSSFDFINSPVKTFKDNKQKTTKNNSNLNLYLAFIFAFIGGIILNLMPCVLPVLSLKILSIINKKNNTEAKKDALAYTAGIMVSFASLSLILILLKINNQGVGWGFQLQSPYFVTLLAYVMLGAGLSLSGVFNLGSSLMNIGISWNTKNGLIGSFFTGVLATVVASPCTAPFMATAIGFALSESPVTTLFIFQGLAIGLSSPFLLMAFFPSLFKFLPKPGNWMNTLKEILAFPMYAATGWLLWVASQLTNSSGLGLIILGLLLISISSWLIGKDYKKDYSKKINNTIVFLILLLAVFIPLSSNLSSENNSDVQNNNDTISETFSNEYLDELLSLGSPVFINFTAAWCITCIVNENVVLSDKDFIKALKDNNVTYLKADWTKRSKEISKTLEFYGRSGIPLYILYDREGNYRILNQILSKKVVLNILNKV